MYHNDSPKQGDFEFPIMRFLIASGGKVRINDVYTHIYAQFQGRWTTADHELIEGKKREKRWQNRIRQARRSLVEEGMVRTSPYTDGLWELTRKGMENQWRWD